MNYHTLSPRILLSFLAVSLTLLSAVSFALLPTDAQTSELTLTPLGEVVGFDDIEGVAFDDKYIYVSETGDSSQIKGYRNNGSEAPVTSVSVGLVDTGNILAGVSDQNQIRIDCDKLYVADYGNHRLLVLQSNYNSCTGADPSSS